MRLFRVLILYAFFLSLLPMSASASMLASSNIPLDSSIYAYLDKLAGFGLIRTDIKGIRPFSKAEAARLLLEAEQRLAADPNSAPAFANDLVARIRQMIPREVALKENPGNRPQLFDYNPVSSVRARYVYLDGAPRDYLRLVNDPGNEGFWGIGHGLRDVCASYPCIATQRGSEGTPMSENNNGVVYHQGFNSELRWAAEGYISDIVVGLLEPSILYSKKDSLTIKLNRAYLKLGGDWMELQVGKDENWLGLGYRGNVTLTNNAENLELVKVSSPEPFRLKWLSWLLGDMKYTIIGSRLDRTVTDGQERRPWFYAMKVSVKPHENLELGAQMAHMAGGPGVNNSFGAIMRGLIGGYGEDNANGLAGHEIRYRIPWLRNTELYGEVSYEDSLSVESYVAGVFIPRITESGKDDFRFEFFKGNRILYTHSIFPEGYMYKNLPIGHSQGGATEDYYFRYSHWFNVRNNLAFEFIHTNRGKEGRLAGQAVEKKYSGRISWTLPVYGQLDAQILYGMERVNNMNLVGGVDRTNHLVKFELRYMY
jgi:hypothetical protein